MSLLFASDTIICYIDELICNRNLQTNQFFNKYHICFPLICSYNKIVSLSAVGASRRAERMRLLHPLGAAQQSPCLRSEDADS